MTCGLQFAFIRSNRSGCIYWKEPKVACPYFVPREVLNDGSWPHPSRLPLGAGWRGECCASGVEVSPLDSEIREYCNLGYARGCPRLPQERDWDAVRFSVASAKGDKVTLLYVCELGHAPVEHGKLAFDLNGERWLDAPADARVRRLAECYLKAYRDRRAKAII